MMPQATQGYQPMSNFNLQNTNDFIPKPAPPKAPNEPMSKESAIFLPGQGSIPGTQQAPPTYNSNVGHGFTMQRGDNDFTPSTLSTQPTQSAMPQVPQQKGMNVNVASFVPQSQKWDMWNPMEIVLSRYWSRMSVYIPRFGVSDIN